MPVWCVRTAKMLSLILPGRLNTGMIQKPMPYAGGTNVSVDSTVRTIGGAGIIPAPLAAPVP